MSGTFSLTLSGGTTAPADASILELNFGVYGPDNSLVTTDSLTFGSNVEAGTASFSNGSGVFQGLTGSSWAPSPSNENNVNAIATDYLAAVDGGAVTLNFASPQQYFGLLWGSVNSGNLLSFYNGTTLVASISADDLINSYGATAQYNYFVSINIPGGYTSVVASSSYGGFEFTNISYAGSIVADPASGPGVQLVTPYDPTAQAYLCFLEGTMIAVPGGAQSVETLQPGALVSTADGKAEPVRWVGLRRVSRVFADPLRAYPVRISAGALAEGVPMRDLCISPDHALLLEGILVQAGALVNGSTIRRETRMAADFTYYHIELASHALLLAEGIAAESFVDNADRGHFDNWATHPGGPAIAELELPRAKSARQIPAALRARLAARASANAA